MKKQHLFIILAVVLLGFAFGIIQYYQALKTEDVSAVTVGIPNPGHSLAQLECSADSLCVDVENKRVGIGTANPGQKLEIAGNLSIPNNALVLSRNNNTTGAISRFLSFSGADFADIGMFAVNTGGSANKNAGLNFIVHAWDYGTNQNFNFSRWEDGGRLLENIGVSARISVGGGNSYFNANGGNVGIGTTSPITKLDVVGDIVGNAQVFRAYMSSNFSKAATWEKLPFNSVLFNTLQGTFDSSNYRFTASRAGYYQISITGYSQTGSSNNDRYGIAVYKNGITETIAGSNYSSVDTPLSGPTINVYLNGSTDYVEIWMYSAIASTLGGGSSGYGMLWSMSYLGR